MCNLPLRSSGDKKGSFRPAAAEEAKRVLRGIYYRQKSFRRERGHYASSLDSLGMEARVLQHFRWPPVIQVTDHQFEAQLEEASDLDADGAINRWFIRRGLAHLAQLGPLPRLRNRPILPCPYPRTICQGGPCEETEN